MFNWTVKQPVDGAVVAPDERLPWPQTAAMGVQHVIAMFGATVLAPMLMGFDPNIAMLMSGVGTLIFFVITGGRVPSYLGSTFAFICVVIAATGYAGKGPNANIARGAGRHHRLRRGLCRDRPRRHGGRHALDRAADAAGGDRRRGGRDRPQPRDHSGEEHGADRLRCLDAGRDLPQRRPGRGLSPRAWCSGC